MRVDSRILINTLATYARSLLVLALGLFSTRWVLQGLGAVDFGLFGVVGSIIVFVTFFNTVMSMSVSRHFSFALGRCRMMGREDVSELRAWFNASLSVHFFIPTVLVLVGYPVGIWVIREWLVIPPNRLETCTWVFRLAVISAFLSMMAVPFRAVYVARQRIAEQVIYEMMGAVVSFAFAWSLLCYVGDRLFYYAAYQTGVGVLFSFIYVVRAWVAFPETRICFADWWNREKIRELVGFASWNLFGALGWLGNNQGMALVGNKFFGPLANAALNIAAQVSGQVTALTNALTTALNPEIVATEGTGDRSRAIRLAFTSCRLASLLNLLFMLPLVFEMRYVLELWLKTPPEGAVLFCRIALLTALFNSLSVGHAVAMGAEGHIRGYQVTIGTLMLLSIPLAWFGCKAGLPVWTIPGASALAVAVCSLGRVWWARRLLKMSVQAWTRDVLIPILFLCVLTGGALGSITFLLPVSFGRLLLTSGVGVLIVISCALAFVLSPVERDQIRMMVLRLLQKTGFGRPCVNGVPKEGAA